MISFSFCIISKDTRQVIRHSQWVEWRYVIWLCTADAVNLDHLVKVVSLSSRILYHNAIIFCFAISHLGRGYFETTQISSFCLKFYSPVLAFFGGPWLKQLLLWGLMVIFLFILSTLIHWNSSLEKGVTSTPFTHLPTYVFLSVWIYKYLFKVLGII